MSKREAFVEKDAAECFRNLCRDNKIAFKECGAYNSHLIKFTVEDKSSGRFKDSPGNKED